MSLRRAALACVAAAVACGTAIGPRPLPGSDRRALCAGLDNVYACSRAVEARQLRSTGGRVLRSGDTLTLRLGGGHEQRLVDRGAAGNAVRYTYDGYLPSIRYHVVHVHLHEGEAFLLLGDDRGDRLPLDGRPVVSPYATKVAVASYAGESGSSPNTLEIWAITDRGLFLEWAVHGDDWGAEDPRWASPATVRYTRVSRCGRSTLCREPGSLQLVDDEWRVR